MSFIDELKRRNVFRVAIAYILMGWVLLQAADFALDLVDAPNWVIQVFFIAVLIGLPIALFFSWAFEVTPEGIKREQDVDRTASITPVTGRRIDRAIIVFLVLAVALLLFDRMRMSEPEPAAELASAPAPESTAEPVTTAETTVDERSIAVLPLANRSTNPEDAFFAEGIHDEILTQLSRISALRVISRTSVMGYASTTKRMPEIGEELGVANLLEGGVQRSGNRVRINVQLIEAATDEHLWAEVYDRELTADNLFDIQSDITRAIADALQAVLTGEEQQDLDRKPTENVEAYAHYLRGKSLALAYGRNAENRKQSITAFESALALDPQFSEAWAALAVDWLETYWTEERGTDTLAKATQALEKAQALAPDSPETLTATGYWYYWGSLDFKNAIEAFDGALARDPGNIWALRGKGYAMRRSGLLEESLEIFEAILDLDPLSATIPADIAYTLSHLGRYPEAREMIARSKALSPDSPFTLMVAAILHQGLGNFESAYTQYGALDTKSPWFLLGTNANLAEGLEDLDRLEQTANIIIESGQEANGLLFQASIANTRGDLAARDALLEKAETVIRADLDANPNSVGHLANLVKLSSWQGDRAAVDEAVARLHAAEGNDALARVEEFVDVEAYLRIGAYDTAADILEAIVSDYGPWEVAFLNFPFWDEAVAAEPRLQALRQQYRAWRDSVTGP